MTARWTFVEVAAGGETYTVPINPDSMTSPTLDRAPQNTMALTEGVARARTFMAPTAAKEWSFSGAIRTQAHHDALARWALKPGKVRITDHLGRTYEVMMTGFEPTDRQPTRSTPWRLRYTMRTLLLRRIS